MLPDAGYPDLYRPDVEMPPGLVWIPVPRGSFEMGCSVGDSSCWAGEYPRHGVAVAAFEMTETEITQSQYLFVVGSNPSLSSTCADCPVERVGWQEARAFCAAVGGRLPSEAEWEYAARAGTTTAWYCGAEQSCVADIAWVSASATQPVKQKTANAFGLHDMLGNVWEWVEDCLHEDYESAPSTAVVRAGGDCDYRIVRGGKFNQGAGYARSSTRGVSEVGATSEGVGLRCVR